MNKIINMINNFIVQWKDKYPNLINLIKALISEINLNKLKINLEFSQSN